MDTKYNSSTLEFTDMLSSSYEYLIPAVMGFVLLLMMVTAYSLVTGRSNPRSLATNIIFLVIGSITIIYAEIEKASAEEGYEKELALIDSMERRYYRNVKNIDFEETGGSGLFSFPSQSTILDFGDAKYKLRGTMKLNIGDSLYALYHENSLRYFIDNEKYLYKPLN